MATEIPDTERITEEEQSELMVEFMLADLIPGDLISAAAIVQNSSKEVGTQVHSITN